MGIISFITGSDNRKQVKKLDAIANKVEKYEDEYRALSEEQLKAKTAEFRDRLEHNYETLDDILPEAFAAVREASFGYAPLSRSVDGRHRAPSGTYRGDAYRRR